jgi:hypothetical protein
VTSNVDRSQRTAPRTSQAPRVSANAAGQFPIREIRCWQCGEKHHLKDCRKATDAQKKALYDKHKAERAKALQRQPQQQNGHRGSPRRPAFVPRRPPREGANNAQDAEQHDTPAGEQQTERKSVLQRVREQRKTTHKLMPYASATPAQHGARSRGPTTYTKYMVPKPTMPSSTATTVSSPRRLPHG